MSNQIRELDTLFVQLNSLNIGSAREALGRLREIFSQQDETIRNLNNQLKDEQNRNRDLNSSLATKDERIANLENQIRDLNSRNNEGINQIIRTLGDHTNSFTRINERLNNLPNNLPELVNLSNRINENIGNLRNEIQPLRNDLTQIKNNLDQRHESSRLSFSDIQEKLNQIAERLDNNIEDSIRNLLDLMRNNGRNLTEYGETLNNIRLIVNNLERGRSRCYGEQFVDQYRQYIPNNVFMVIAFVVFLIGMFICFCGNKYSNCMVSNCTMKSC
jgi:predicted  nucleic acid-binding Zn-ribbon protein